MRKSLSVCVWALPPEPEHIITEQRRGTAGIYPVPRRYKNWIWVGVGRCRFLPLLVFVFQDMKNRACNGKRPGSFRAAQARHDLTGLPMPGRGPRKSWYLASTQPALPSVLHRHSTGCTIISATRHGNHNPDLGDNRSLRMGSFDFAHKKHALCASDATPTGPARRAAAPSAKQRTGRNVAFPPIVHDPDEREPGGRPGRLSTLQNLYQGRQGADTLRDPRPLRDDFGVLQTPRV